MWPSSRNSVWTRCVKLLNALASSKTLILAPSIGSHESLVRDPTISAGATLARPRLARPGSRLRAPATNWRPAPPSPRLGSLSSPVDPGDGVRRDRRIRDLRWSDAGLREGARPGRDKDPPVHADGALKRARTRAPTSTEKRPSSRVFAQNKFNRSFRRFQRRGRAAALSEWRLVTATHNLLKLHAHWIQAAIC
jgi:hypothetical protein